MFSAIKDLSFDILKSIFGELFLAHISIQKLRKLPKSYFTNKKIFIFSRFFSYLQSIGKYCAHLDFFLILGEKDLIYIYKYLSIYSGCL